MPYEVWLRPNRRPAIVKLSVCAAALVVTVVVLSVCVPPQTASHWIAAIVATALGLAAASAGVMGWVRASRSRVYCRNGEVMFRLQGDRTIGVPLEVVEAFFLGQGPAHLPHGRDERLESINLVARLSQRASQWHSRSVDPRLGAWCDGYITVRGTYCEPLNVDLVQRLNRRLADAKRDAATGR
jgi:hypothetical protein